MKYLLWTMVLRAPDDGGGNGGGGDGAAPPAPAGDGGAPVSPPPAAPGGAGDPPAGGDPASPPPAGADPYFPKGLPDTMKGKTERETMDRMAEALAGYRNRDATRDVPQDVGGYLNLDGIEGLTVDETIKPYFAELTDDGVFKAAAEVAKADGVSRGTFAKMMNAVFSEAQKGGILEPPVDVAAERAALLPDTAKSLPKAQQDQAIDRRMAENEAFVDLLVANEAKKPEGERRITAEDAEHVKMMLGDSAKGHRFLEFVRASIATSGQQPLGRGGAGAGNDSRDAMKAELAKPEMQSNHPEFDKAKYDALMERYKAAFPD